MQFTLNKSYSNFTLQQKQTVKEIGAEVFLFQHQRLDCPLLAIKNDDTNKTFAVSFRTIPTDSTGVAHVLEHSVLMGSKKYPVKDVFGEINKGGLMTFLNAMTGSDLTYYPFATRNEKEYFNLMDIYCDVVFNPLLDRTTFEQEGWHYHLENYGDPLKYQGVVYNEMKGAFSDPIRLIFQHIFRGLMPGSTYAHESGGDPVNIPDLSYEQFCDFHKKHYHPSNSVFFLYGNAPLEQELEYLDNNFLSQFQEKGDRAVIAEGQLTEEYQFIDDTYAVESSDTTDKTFLAVGSNVSTVLDRQKNNALQVIANILYNSDASPLKQAIISSGLCKDFGGFYMASSSYRTFMITYLIGSNKESRESFLKLYKQSLTDMVTNGLDRDLLLSELNKYEFSVREEASRAQRGLNLIGKTMPAFQYGIDPFGALEIEELFQTIRHKALKEKYFEQLISEHLLDNKATVVVSLSPDPKKSATVQEKEQTRLNNYADSLSTPELDSLLTRTTELTELQQQPNSVETLSLLPQLSLTDLPTDIAFHTVVPAEISGRPFLINELVTNHISYLDAGFDISAVPQRLLPLLNIFATIVTEIGTKKMDYVRFATEIATCTGGFSHSTNTYTRQNSTDTVDPVLWFHLKCLPEYLDQSISLLAEVFSEISFSDRAHIKEIVTREFAWAEHAAQSEGYTLPLFRAFSHLSLAGSYNELINGVSNYKEEKQLAANYDSLEESFLQDLEELSSCIFNKNNLTLCLTADQEEISRFKKIGSSLVEALPDTTLTIPGFNHLDIQKHEAFITSAEVVFAIQAGSLLAPGEYNGHFEVLKTYLSRDYLWNSVRQMGGAYGCFIQFSHISGNFALVSYRDPQVQKTYNAYAGIPDVVASLEIADEVLEQLVIGTYGSFNPHQSSAARGATARNEYLSGITVQEKQQRMEAITATTVNNLRAFAPAFKQMMPSGYRKIIGNRAKIEADKDLFNRITDL